MAKHICSVDGCERKHEARDLCHTHYEHWRRYGSAVNLSKPTIEERFWSKVDKDGPVQPNLGTPCWLWIAGSTDPGRGIFYPRGVPVYAHRFAYELLIGPITDDLHLDHRCHNSPCVNPDHLRPVTTKQNNENRRGANRNSQSGVRGVYWNKTLEKWTGSVGHHGQTIHVGLFTDLDAAEAAVIAKRNELHTHNDKDRT